MDSAGMPALDLLRMALNRRGWSTVPLGTGMAAHKREWPAPLKLVVNPGGASAASLIGVMLDFRFLPLRGERFKDIFNSERLDLLRRMGEFRVRSQRPDMDWTRGISGRAFLDDDGPGLGRNARVVLFDRHPSVRDQDFVEAFSVEFLRVVDTGNGIAHLLRRTYPWALLENAQPLAGLPDTVSAPPVVAQPAVVGRRLVSSPA